MNKFLYGASVQGIQNFIFKTNKLKDIVGASNLVNYICTGLFKETLVKSGGRFDENNVVIMAAGNIKYVFENEDDCKELVRIFPKTVMTTAPGITISQAVVRMAGENETFESASGYLEELLRAQRNKPLRPVDIGLIGVQRSRQTGAPVLLPADDTPKKELLDYATYQKRRYIDNHELFKKSFGITDENLENTSTNINNLTGENDWIAIIHADGNGLGRIVQQIGSSKEVYHDFSIKLDEATKESAQHAFRSVAKSLEKDGTWTIPIRPIVLGGDDMTAITRGDIAVDYARAFLEEFEKLTKSKFPSFQNGLTACAGITFIKSSFPFHYGYTLAEQLCGYAKKIVKSSPGKSASAIMFHKVQDSYTEDFTEIVSRELTTPSGSSFAFGPYGINNHGTLPEIGSLLHYLQQLDTEDGNALKSHLRKWMSTMYQSESKSAQMLKRMHFLFDSNLKDLIDFCERKENNAYPVYDLLSLHSIIYQKTK